MKIRDSAVMARVIREDIHVASDLRFNDSHRESTLSMLQPGSSGASSTMRSQKSIRKCKNAAQLNKLLIQTVDLASCSRSPTVQSTIDSARNSSENWSNDPLGQHSDQRSLHAQPTPRTIVQFWHDLARVAADVEECIASWTRWETSRLHASIVRRARAKAFISGSLGARHERAFERCYHPAMQADYFRLCYLLVEGGFYVDADDVCVRYRYRLAIRGRPAQTSAALLRHRFWDNGEARLCFFILMLTTPAGFSTSTTIHSLQVREHPIIERALSQATGLLELAGEDVLPEIQTATGPGNLSKSIFELGTTSGGDIESDLVVLRDWDSIAVSKWPLSYRDDARNWRLSNQKRFSIMADSPNESFETAALSVATSPFPILAVLDPICRGSGACRSARPLMLSDRASVRFSSSTWTGNRTDGLIWCASSLASWTPHGKPLSERVVRYSACDAQTDPPELARWR